MAIPSARGCKVIDPPPLVSCRLATDRWHARTDEELSLLAGGSWTDRGGQGRLRVPPWTATSAEDAVAVAPSDEDVYRPDPRPIQARCPVEEGPPEPLHRCGVEAGRSDGLRVPQGLVHYILQAAPDPPIERQHEPALASLKQRRVEAA